ncbi:Ig-like domain-containing protein [Aquisphaera insulae]|uniref:Ig-like domain-containing protein n=1 Tax=Aquisphaera insulae TaxID=2712864 RepID=UPI0013EAEEA3|nr:Ig-like domain-containing protein [Aquisphaera insulae]
MLSTTSASGLNLFGSGTSSTQNIPITFAQKQLRIQKVPYNMRALQPNRYLPPELITQIQLGLEQSINTMVKPPSQALTNYNNVLRDITFKTSISSGNASRLNHAFEAVLRAAQTPEPALTTLVSSVSQLVTQVDTASIQPNFLATNDSAYILQAALILGQKMPAPRAPTIAKSSGSQINPRAFASPLSTPSFVGSYEFGTTVQMVNVHTGEVLGSAVVSSNNQYALHVTTPLAVGKYTLAVQAVDEVGHISRASQTFGLQIVPPKNAG